ncbi:MAG: DUF5009 domain-containing protein [Balneolaceae bacterium]|nr:DUF5009 domain-containing protein [Balneolaceae bacterium]
MRIVSVDFLRGLTIALMILVNNPGSWGHLFKPLSHAHWNGCTPTDLIFPFFIFIVGAAIAFSLGSKKKNPANHKQLIIKVIKRGLIIIALGILKDNFPFWVLDGGGFAFWGPEVWRIPGVLQRIGLVYIFTGLLFIKSGPKVQLGALVACLLGYWGLINIEIPGAFVKDLSQPGGNNFGAWLDVQLLGKNHLWAVSRNAGWDPESLLGTIPAVGTCLLGVMAGRWIKEDRPVLQRISRLFVWGSVLICLGLLWDMVFPINKTLWTSSYVLYSGGIAMSCTAFCMWVMDFKGHKKIARPFVAFGSNALLAYLLSEMTTALLHRIPWGESTVAAKLSSALLSLFTDYSFSEIGVGHPDLFIAKFASHLYAFLWILPFYFLLHWMYKRKIFVKV